MKQRLAICLVAALLATPLAIGRPKRPRVVVQTIGRLRVTVYTVTDPASFRKLRLPEGFAFRNGLAMLPGLGYIDAGGNIQVIDAELAATDTIIILSLVP